MTPKVNYLMPHGAKESGLSDHGKGEPRITNQEKYDLVIIRKMQSGDYAGAKKEIDALLALDADEVEKDIIKSIMTGVEDYLSSLSKDKREDIKKYLHDASMPGTKIVPRNVMEKTKLNSYTEFTKSINEQVTLNVAADVKPEIPITALLSKYKEILKKTSPTPQENSLVTAIEGEIVKRVKS